MAHGLPPVDTIIPFGDLGCRTVLTSALVGAQTLQLLRPLPAPPPPPRPLSDSLLPHPFSFMSLNCKGLRSRNGRRRKGNLTTLVRKRLLQRILSHHLPDVMALQETWHMPHDDLLRIPGYRYYGRPRRRPDGSSATSGGVGFLISNRLPEGSIHLRPHFGEAGSTGSLWLDLTLQNGSKISVGTIYSECSGKKSTMGLVMEDVWRARAKGLTDILDEDGGSRPVFLLGDMNVHIGGFQEVEGSHRAPLYPTPTPGQKKFAEPFRSVVKALPLAVLNGRIGGTEHTCFPSVPAACARRPVVIPPTPGAPKQRASSTIDLALTRDTHVHTHAAI